jgi:hypothetical protein
MKRRARILLALLAPLALLTDAAAAASPAGALVRVDRPPTDAAARLLDGGIVVVRDAGWYLLAVAADSQLGYFDRLGLSYRVVDVAVDGKTYFTVSRVGPDRARELARTARVLYAHDGSAVVEGPEGTGDLLARSGFEVQRVFMRPVVARRIAAYTSAAHHRAEIDTWIQGMVTEVSKPVIDGYVQRLQDFVTRWALHDSCRAAADWIEAQFRSFGLDSVYYQDIGSMFKGNVVAVLPGRTIPGEIIVLGGHYDSVSNNAYIAPGADDNASGTACVLQCARILSHYPFDRTIVFAAFGAEEQGLRGSEYFASLAAAAGDNIVAMINVDMLGYRAWDDEVDIDVIGDAPSSWLRDRALEVAAAYIPGTPAVVGSLPEAAVSDHISFWDHGYDAIMFWEDSEQPSPYLHTLADTIGLSYNYPFLAQQSTKLAVALAAELAGPSDAATGAEGVTPPSVSLEQNVPNPFNPRTMIRFTIPPPGASASLIIYDVKGRRVAALVDEESLLGTRTVWWNGTGADGRPVPSGVYFYRLTAGRQVLSRKMVLLR